MDQRGADTLDFLAGGGAMGALVRDRDWSDTPLGPIGTWPQSLRTAVSLCLNARVPIVLFWGRGLIQIYNDAWRAIIGAKHPAALGQPAGDCWAEIRHIIQPMLAGVLESGKTTGARDTPLLIDRTGYVEETWFTTSFSPIRLEDGSVGGVFGVMDETTRRIIAERRMRLLSALPAYATEARTADEACRRAAGMLGSADRDITFALIYRFDRDSKAARLAAAAGLPAGTPASPDIIDPHRDDSWPIAEILRTGAPVLARNADGRLGALPGGAWNAPSTEALVLPIGPPDAIFGFLVAGLSPRKRLDEDYRAFLETVAGHIATAIAHGRRLQTQADIPQPEAPESTSPRWQPQPVAANLQARQSGHAESDDTQDAMARRIADIAAHFPGAIYRRIQYPDGTVSFPYISGGLAGIIDLPTGGNQAMTLRQLGTRVMPEDRKAWRRALAQSARTLQPYRAEGRVLAKDGSIRWMCSMAHTRKRDDGTTIWDGVILDITDLKETQERLQASLAEKEVLLREVHHRIKNNLQVISSLINMEARATIDPISRSRFEALSRRIAVLGRIHEQLYAQRNLNRIDLVQHLNDLIDALAQSMGRPGVSIEVDAAALICDLDTAIPIGLIAGELVANSLKHGFRDGRSGHVRLSLRPLDGGQNVELAVADNGMGADASLLDRAGGLGMLVVRALARQLGASIAIDSGRADGAGLQVSVTIPRRHLG